MRRLSADDRVERTKQQADAENVGCGPVEDEVGSDRAERRAQLVGGPACPVIGAVRLGIASVRGRDRGDHLGVRASMVVAAKALMSSYHRLRLPSTLGKVFTRETGTQSLPGAVSRRLDLLAATPACSLNRPAEPAR